MKLNTGKVAFNIEFDNGDKQAIYFNPNDPDLMSRMSNLQKKIQSRTEKMDDFEMTIEGKPVHDAYIEFFDKAQQTVKDELDCAFGGEISDVVFKHCSPFAVVDGEYFIVQFIKAITPEIVKHIEKTKSEMEAKMSKHIDKYKK
jgi:hypothetical protein